MNLSRLFLVLSLIASLSIGCGGEDTPVADADAGDLTDVDTDAGDSGDSGDVDEDTDTEPREGPVAVAPDDVTISATAGQSASADFDIENPGTETLTVNVLSPNAGLRVSPASLEVGAGDAGTVSVSATCPATGTGTYASDLTVNTNDPENATFPVTVRLICGTPGPGSLLVSVEGLEAGLTPVLNLRADDGTQTPVDGEELVEDLEPGDYTLIADPVVEGLRTFTAEDVALTIESDTQADVTISFGLVPAAWEIVIEGLPSDLDPNITVEGPEDIGPLTGPQTFAEITPGSYELTPEPVEDGGFRYLGQPANVELASGDDTTTTLVYDLMLADLDVSVAGLPSGADADITITGPEDYESTITSAQVLSDLRPGTYELTPADVTSGGIVYSAQSTTVELSSEETATAEITYVAPPTTLALAYDLGDAGSYTLEIVDASDTVVDTVTVNGQGSTSIEVDPGTYSVRATTVPTDTWDNDFYITGGQDVVVAESTIVTASIEAVEPTLITRTGDSGQGSLREVIGRVNADSIVTFATGVDQVEVTGSQISLARNISIIGNGRDTTEIMGVGAPLRIFSVTNPAALILFQSLSISGARATTDQGGAIYNQADLTLFDVRFDDNRATNGGAIYNTPNALLTIDEAIFTNNQASQRGGAIYNAGGMLADKVRFSSNSALVHGGAIFAPFNGGSTTIPLAETTLDRALLELNTAPDGGAISVSSLLSVENSTFDANVAEGDGGAIFVSNLGQAAVNFSTFAGNDAARGAAMLLDGSAASSLELSRSILAGNTITGATGVQLERVSTESAIVSGGDNFISAADLTDIDEDTTDTIGLVASPLASPLGTLADNGGFTRTIEVVEASQADLSIAEARCLGLDDSALTVDQRGEARPFEGQCTIGAWQLAPPSGPFTETFDSLEITSSTYVDGDFVGVNGLTWEYAEARSESGYEIDGKGIMIRETGSYVRTTIPGGVSEVSVDYRKAFTGGTTRQIEIRVDGAVVATSPTFGSPSGRDDTVYTLNADSLGISSDVVVEIHNISGGQIVIDNITWE